MHEIPTTQTVAAMQKYGGNDMRTLAACWLAPNAAYRLTRNGFTLLAMGFTGKKALRFKLAYIDAFNRMEAELQNPACAPAALLLFGQSDPVPLPSDIEIALRRRTWDLTRQAHDLIDEHLRRRVAYRAVRGHHEKFVDADLALQALNSGDLGDALAHTLLEKTQRIASFFQNMENMLRDYQQHVQTSLSQLRRSA